jgi:uncharacterized damage-inducible protein DinB
MTKAILEQFEASTHHFCQVARAIPAEKLEIVPAPGEWPASYVIHHLADSDAHFLVRFLNVLSTEKPTIVPFDEEAFPTALRYLGRTVETSLAAIEASCSQTVEILEQLSPSDWERSGFHPERGEMTLTQILALTTNHRLEHIEQLKKY